MEKLHALVEKFLEYMVQFADLKAVVALKDGFILTLPLTLAGSVFLLIGNLPIAGYPEFMAATFGADWADSLKQVSGATFDVLAILSVLGISYKYAEAALLTAKSAQMKQLSKLSLVPGLFNINEPIIFGLPIVFNPYLLVPFVFVPIFAVIITYTAIAIGFMPAFSAVQVPWTTPPIIAGFLLSGWQGVVVQCIVIAVAVLSYLPFVKVQDRVFVKEEEAASGAAQSATESNTDAQATMKL